MDAIRKLLEGARAQFEALRERERRLAIGFLVALVLLATGGLVYGLQSLAADQRSRVVVARDALLEVQEMSAELQGLQAKIDAAKGRMRGFHANQMNTYLEGWAKKAGVSDTLTVKPGQAVASGSFQSVPYQVSFSRAELGAVVTFLHALETSPYPIRIRSARFKAEGRQDARTIRADLEVVAYSEEHG